MNRQQLEVLIRHLKEAKHSIGDGMINPADIVTAYNKISEIIITLENHYNETEEL